MTLPHRTPDKAVSGSRRRISPGDICPWVKTPQLSASRLWPQDGKPYGTGIGSYERSKEVSWMS